MAQLEMPAVSECTATGCSYNHDGCHAFAITVTGRDGSADCGTFIPLSTRGGLDRVLAQVGACQRGDCVHNAELACTAESVKVGAGAVAGSAAAGCLTYATA